MVFFEIEYPSQNCLLLNKQQRIIGAKDVIGMAKGAGSMPPVKTPIAAGGLTTDEFYAEVKRGYDDCIAGRTHPAEEVFRDIETEFEYL